MESLTDGVITNENGRTIRKGYNAEEGKQPSVIINIRAYIHTEMQTDEPTDIVICRGSLTHRKGKYVEKEEL